MRIMVLCVALAAMAAGCVYHHEVKSEPDRGRMEFSVVSTQRA
jgi:hypothetical protein